MYRLTHPLFLFCESPLHAGTGASLGTVDLPIQRERHTQFPKIESSSLKGALRQQIESVILRDLDPNESPEEAMQQAREALTMLNRYFGYDPGTFRQIEDFDKHFLSGHKSGQKKDEDEKKDEEKERKKRETLQILCNLLGTDLSLKDVEQFLKTRFKEELKRIVENVEEKISEEIKSDETKATMKRLIEHEVSERDVERLLEIKAEIKPKPAKEFSASIGFTDARLLFFPVKSLKGVFAWVSCPQVLGRFVEEMRMMDSGNPLAHLGGAEAFVPNTVPFGSTALFDSQRRVMLEEYQIAGVSQAPKGSPLNQVVDFVAERMPQNYWRQKIRTDVVVLEDEMFRDLTTLCTEVITRVKIDNERGSVADGALFTEEFLPSESVLYSLASFSDDQSGWHQHGEKATKVRAWLAEQLKASPVFQVGGDATLGKGLTRAQLFVP